MKNPSLLALLSTLIFISNNAQANTDKVCESLYRLTCAPGTYEDGTGAATTGNILSNKAQDDLNVLYKKSVQNFTKHLKDPENSYFRKSVLSGTGLILHPECVGAEKSPKATCLQLMAEGLTNLLAKDQMMVGVGFGGPQMSGMGGIQDVTYITDSQVFKAEKQALIQGMRKALNQEGLEKKVKDKVFPSIKKLLLAKIEASVKDPNVKENLKEKVAAIEFAGTDCSKESGAESSISGLLFSNAFYNQTQNVFKYCMGFASRNTSEFHLANVIAHELAHSIDPCGITMGPSDYAFKYKGATLADAEKEFPFEGIPACLRGQRSAQAVALAQTPGGQIFNNGNLQPPPNSFCKNDQVTECFSDWIAAEILPEYIQENFPKLTTEQKRFGYSNVWRNSCGNGYTGLGVHPKDELRVNNVMLAQPKIRAQMNCPEKSENADYCSLGFVAPAAVTSEPAPGSSRRTPKGTR